MELRTAKKALLHPYSKGSLAFAFGGLFLNALIFFALSRGSQLFVTLAMDNIFLTGFCLLGSLGLGVHTLLKMRWPGDTVFEKYHKPRSWDLAALSLAFAVSAVNFSALWFYIMLLTAALKE